MPTFRYVVADVFTDMPLEGNQLAVFTDARDIPEEQLLPLARELKFSETVFALPPEAGGHVRIRIFTPSAELPFAGHPCLGAAFVLGGPLQLGEIRLETGVGIVPVQLEREGARIVFGRMVQPVPSVEPYAQAEELLGALGVVPEHAHLAAVALAVALEDLDRRRLAGAVRAEEAEHLALLDLEVDPADRLELSVRLAQAANGDCAQSRSSSTSACPHGGKAGSGPPESAAAARPQSG